MKRPFLVSALFAALALASCGIAPSKEAESQDIFSYTLEATQRLSEAQYREGSSSKAQEFYRRSQKILTAAKGDKIILEQKVFSPPSKNNLVHPLGDGTYAFSRGVYLTTIHKRALISFDAKTWYETGSQYSKAATPNLQFRFHFEPQKQEGQSLLIYYSAELDFNPEAEPYLGRIQRSLYQSSPSQEAQLINSQAKDKSQLLDLSKYMIFIPSGTLLHYRILASGNLLQISADGPQMTLSFERDLYFYYPRRLFASVSFDGEYWGHNYFNFSIKQQTLAYYQMGEGLFYRESIELNLKGD